MPKQVTKIVLSGYYGFDNYGDELILRTLIETLKSRGIAPIVLSGNPSKTSQTYGVNAISRTNPLQILSALLSSKGLISGGGGLFQDSTSLKSPIYYGTIILLAKLCGKSVAFFGQGIGPLKNSLASCLTSRAISWSQLIVVRDKASLEWIREHTAKTPESMADTVWGLKSSSENSTAKSASIAVSLRPHPSLTSQFIEELASQLETLSKSTQMPITLLNCQHHEDAEPLERLALQLKTKGVTNVTIASNIDDINASIHAASMCIAMRFHVLVMALKSQTPVYALAYDPKVTQLAQKFNAPYFNMYQKTHLPNLQLQFNQVDTQAIDAEIEDAEQGLQKLSDWASAL